MSSFYLTTPIYYVNDLPHIGHIYTTVVGDAATRYQRMAGSEVYFLTGTDEHGQKIERAAREKGLAPQALADRVVERYRDLWKTLDIAYDVFSRTTSERHRLGAQEIARRIEANGDLYVDRHEGWYCAGCELFYTEKELEGDERRCPIHETPAEWKSEENVFFRLSSYTDRLLAWYDENPHAVRPASRRNEVRSFVQEGLRDLSVSRAGLEWGIPFPDKPGQTMYVWLEALSNYITALGFGSDDGEGSIYDRFWRHGDTRIQLVGKDIVRFHAVYWPAFLMSAGLPVPTTVWAHGWWLMDDKKMSKSSGNVVRPDYLIEAYGADALRYFLLREMAFGQDATFSDEAFIDRYNGDLANELGNSVSRLVTLSRRAFDGKTPPAATGGSTLEAAAREAASAYREAMEELAFHKALESLWQLLSATSSYLVEHEPWKLIKDESRRGEVGEVLWNGLEAVRIVATGLLPVMPGTARQVLAAIGSPDAPETLDAMAWGGTPTSAELPEKQSLFPRIDKEAYMAQLTAEKEEKAKTAQGPDGAREEVAAKDDQEDDGEDTGLISIDRFFETELKVGKVLEAERIPKSSKLLKLTIDLGEGEPRTVVAGLAKAYEPEALVGRLVVVVANLEPAQLMGVRSQGMVLAASVDGRPVVVHPGEEVPVGTTVR